MKKEFLTHEVPSGTSCDANLFLCIAKAKKYKERIIFIFNYCDIFEVYPDGRWICRRIGGGMPLLGHDSEFVPKEGWSKFFGH